MPTLDFGGGFGRTGVCAARKGEEEGGRFGKKMIRGGGEWKGRVGAMFRYGR